MPSEPAVSPRSLRVDHARKADAWISPAHLEWDSAGVLVDVRTARPGEAADVECSGFALPALPNVHSHAFQRAMSGHAESRHATGGGGTDSFWTWREEMYGLAETMDDKDLEIVASWLFVEMLESGTTALGEFHYLHHDPGAYRPSPRGRYSEALLRAAQATGISLTLLPVLYMQGGFDRKLEARQRRFGHDSVEDFLGLYETLRAPCAKHGAELGLAFHSVRAVRTDAMREIMQAIGEDLSALHVHVSEQSKEVEDCLAATGRRPLRLLLREGFVDERCCLVHATHLDDGEVADAAASGAIAGLCPTTEANLGDGIFRLPEWLQHGGAFAIGSDSHISIDPLEELRLLEYGQRLTRQQRAVAALPETPHVGEFLWLSSCKGGAKALGQPVGELAAGQRADFVILDPAHPRMLGHGPETACDAAIFSSSSAGTPLREVWSAGQRVVRDGRHRQRADLLARFEAWTQEKRRARP